MALSIYKSGLGYWTRLGTAVAAGILGTLGGYWLWEALAGADWGIPTVYAQSGAALLLVTLVAIAAWWLVAVRPASVDFFIATETEMKKVNWSSRREVVGSSIVVIVVSLVLAGFCQLFDWGFFWLFQQLRVLQVDGG